MDTQLLDLYERLRSRFGNQGWWPGDDPWEIAVGAVLTQATNWRNVERAIAGLKAAGALAPEALAALPRERLEQLIAPSGFFRVKADRLAALLRLVNGSRERFMRLGNGDVEEARRRLLSVRGIGPETADSILLYAFGRPTFVVDAYTRRLLLRHGAADKSAGYEVIRRFFMGRLPSDPVLFNDFHAQIVAVGKSFCRPFPHCEGCPAAGWADTVKEMTA